MLETETVNINEFFDIRSPNEWMRASRSIPVPKKLFGDFWQEGEIAIMFADTGKGKSVLSVQIAESIARGRAMQPFEMTAKPQRVLYLDFELTGKQYEMRYTADHEPEKGDFLTCHYRFSDRHKRIEMRPEVLQRQDGKPFEEAIREMLAPLVIESGAKVLIIDNITYLKRTAEGTRESVPLMKELQRLKRRFGLSILLIAHTPKRDARRPLAVNDLQGSKAIANYADNIFAIGQSRRELSERYIKHIKPRSAELMFDASHVPLFRLRKMNRNFLGFEFQGFMSESELLREPVDSPDSAIINKVKELHDGGMSIRAIADELGFSKSTAHRYLNLWQPAEETRDVREETGDASANYFPGREEYDEAKRDPRFEGLVSRNDLDGSFLMRERYLIDVAGVEARKIYKKTGTAPRLCEHQEYREFKEAVRIYKESGGATVLESIAYMFGAGSGNKTGTTNLHETTRNGNPVNSENSANSATPLSRMKHVVDDLGNDRYIESEYADGKPRIWYQYRSDGQLLQYEHNGFVSISKNADQAIFGDLTKICPPPKGSKRGRPVAA